MDQNPVIHFLNGPQPGEEVAISMPETVLGRSNAATIPLDWDTSVSRKHARIFTQKGLWWVEDLQSRNGTTLRFPGGQEMSLQPHEPQLLLEHTQLRLGKHVECEVLGIAPADNAAVRSVIVEMRNLLKGLIEGLPHLAPEIQKEQIALIRRFEDNLLKAKDEKDLLRITAEEINTLHETRREMSGSFSTSSEDEFIKLAPLPDDLPDPDDPDRLFTIRGIFISDIRKCIPDEQKDKGPQND